MTRNYFHNRLDGLGRRKRQIDAPVDITYHRGINSFPIVEVSIGKTDTEEVYPGIDILIKELRDYIFDYADFPTELDMPKPGDKIIEDQTGLECQVVSIGDDHCYKWTTATRKRIRVHTQIITQVNP